MQIKANWDTKIFVASVAKDLEAPVANLEKPLESLFTTPDTIGSNVGIGSASEQNPVANGLSDSISNAIDYGQGQSVGTLTHSANVSGDDSHIPTTSNTFAIVGTETKAPGVLPDNSPAVGGHEALTAEPNILPLTPNVTLAQSEQVVSTGTGEPSDITPSANSAVDVSRNSQITGDVTSNEASQPSTAFLSIDDGAVGVGAENTGTGHGNLGGSSTSGTNVGNTSGATGASGVASGLSATSFQIDVTYDSSVTTSSMATEIETAVNYVVNFFEGLFTNPITINIDVGWGEVAGTQLGSGALGESSTNYDTYAYSNVLSALNSTANASGDAAQLAAYSTLPQTNPTSGNIAVSTAEAKALGLSSGTGLDGAVGFSSSATWSFSPTAAPATGAYYFIGVVEHEISEVMGRLSFVGSSADSVMDLFRYSAPGTRDLSSSHGGTNTTAYFSTDSGTTNLGSWNNVSRNGDLGDWYPSGPAPGGNDAFNDFSTAGVINTLSTNDITLMNVLGYDVNCFMAGTHISTPNSDVAIETLKRGDLVITADGQAKAVSWLGQQTISTVFADPLRVYPIRIKAGALGENVPARDLLLSPDHAVLVGDALIQAGALVNGTSIVRETKVQKIFTYYHLELDDHSLILAENTPAETFIDNVDRLAFNNWAEHEAAYPDGKPLVEMPYPRAKAHRQVPSSIRARLSERAKALNASIVSNKVA